MLKSTEHNDVVVKQSRHLTPVVELILLPTGCRPGLAGTPDNRVGWCVGLPKAVIFHRSFGPFRPSSTVAGLPPRVEGGYESVVNVWGFNVYLLPCPCGVVRQLSLALG